MSRLPVPGSDVGTWAAVLDDFLAQAFNPDGTLKTASVNAALGGVVSAIGDVTIQSDSDNNGAGDQIFKVGLAEVARLKRDGTATGVFGRSLPPSGRVMMALGDSIVANGVLDSTFGSVTVVGGRITEKNWLAWATLISGGRITYGGVAATGGFTTAQILATHLPTILAAKPDACLVLGGTNDAVQGVALSTTIANLTSMYSQLLSNGILPIACTIPPRTGATTSDNTLRTQINLWVTRYARTNGIPLIDFYSALTDTTTAGSYLAALTIDGVHPSGAGAKVMGQAMADAMATWLAPVTPFLSQNNTDPALALANSLMLTDTNADGVPDNWTLSGTGAVGTLATDAAVKGKYFVATRGTADLTAQMASAVTAAAGDKIYFGCRLMTTVKATSSNFDFGLRINVTGGNVFAQYFDTFLEDIPNGSYWGGEIICPATTTGVFLRSVVRGASGALIKIAQPTLINLTAAGIA